MITVRLFGDFKLLAGELDCSGTIGIVKIEKNDLTKISNVLKELDINKDAVSHIFLNGEYSGLNRSISEGGRLAIFPADMGLLYKWYFKKVGK